VLAKIAEEAVSSSVSAWRFCAPILFAVLGACVTTTTPHDLSADNIRALRIERVELALDPAARIEWPQLAQARAQFASVPAQADMTGSTPEPPEQPKLTPDQVRARATADLREKARSVLEPTLRSTLGGTRPIVARMTVNAVKIVTFGEGFAAGVILGPQVVTSGMLASVEFVDARTGAVLMRHPLTGVTTQGGYKLNMGTSGTISHDPVERLMAAYGERLTSWLLKT
jgi:hypothetical protein